MECKECAKNSWSTLPQIDVSAIPDDLEFVCGSDKERKAWRISLMTVLEEAYERIAALEKEVAELRKEKDGK